MDIDRAIAEFLEKHGIGPSPLLLALSGGVDSTAMAVAMASLRSNGYRLAAAHVNHHLRGADSDADRQFVSRLCEQLGFPLEVHEGPLDPESVRNVGVEAAARQSRYALLKRAAAKVGALHIATAHQKNDQAETVLLRLISGSNPSRLAGISPVTREGVIRPLLDVGRTEIEEFLSLKRVVPRLDRTNRDPRFLRNRIREQLLPLLAAWNPAIVDSLAELATQVRERSEILDEITAEAADRWVVKTPVESRFDPRHAPRHGWIRRSNLLAEIRRLDPASRDISAEDLRRLDSLIAAPNRTSVTAALELIREKGTTALRLVAARPGKPEFEIELLGEGTVRVEEIGADVTVRRLDQPTASAGEERGNGRHLVQRFQLPAGSSPERFTIRSRRAGDRFQPLGFRGQKKLKDLLIDRKIPASLRATIPLLIWNEQIVWVAGIEVGERFKVSDQARPLWEATIDYDE